MSQADEILLVYDKQCPACSYYCNLVRIRQTVGELKLVDAREPGAVMDEITARGWDIDQGMVLKVGDALYYGSDAIHAVALLGSSSGFFNRINHWLFKSPARAKYIYPILRAGRGLLLKFMRRTKVNNLDLDDNEYF